MGLINPYNGLLINGGNMGSALGIVDGNAGAPGLYFNNSATTGLYRIGADSIGISIAGALNTTINATGVTLGAAQELFIPAGARFKWLTRCAILSPADGILLVYNNAGADFNRLQFGGTTNLFPALKRDTIFLQLRLADDSAVSGAATGALPAAAAGRDGIICFDTTLHKLVYYEGGARYALTGVAF